MESISNFLENHLPTALFLFIIAIVALVFLVWWAAKMWHELNSRPCKEHSEHIVTHTEKISDIASSLSRIDGKLEILLKVLPLTSQPKENILSNETPVLSQKNSPRVLNDNGLIVSQVFGCESFFSDNKEWLVSELSKFSPKTALDVETYGTMALRIASSDKRFNDIKNKIYNSAALELKTEDGKSKRYEITLEDVLFVLSLYLRDEYLISHPEINS